MKTKLATLLVLSAMTMPVLADTVSYSQTVSGSRTGYTDNSAGPNISIEFSPSYSALLPQFDPTLGTLNSVTISIDSFLSDGSTGTVTNNTASTVTGTFNLTSDASTTFPGFAASDNASESGTFSLAPGASAPLAPFDGPTSVTNTFTISDDMSAYLGTGSLSALINLTSVYEFDTDAIDHDVPFTINAVAKVTYDYTPVPEPTSLALLSLGGIALTRRRRNA